MTIIAANFEVRLSGGAGNANPNASLGGAISTTAYSSATDGLFDAVSAAEASAGRVEFRCVYLRNGHASTQMTTARIWIASQPAHPGSTLEIGVGTSAVNGTEQTVANETTAPTGVTFSAPSTAATGLALGNIPAGQHRAIWYRRTIAAGSGNVAATTATPGLDCETT